MSAATNIQLCILLFTIAVFPISATQQTAEISVAQIVPAELGSAKNVHAAGSLFFAGQFEQSDLQEIKNRKFERIITLRTDGEIDWDEKQAVESAGIEFIEVPFRSPESLDDDVFDQIRSLLKDDSKRTLFHCGSANRVGGVWLPFRVLDEKVDLDIAIGEAEKIGLRTAFIKEKALEYIRRKQTADGNHTGGEKSVKPGINKDYLDPKLNVDDFLKRFEVESREIYSARENIVEAIGLKPGNTVGDIGAGTGLFTRMFSNRVGDSGWVYAVDVSPRLVEHVARESAGLKQRNVTTVLCHEDNINLPPESVDVIFVCDTYHHFEYPKSTLASIHRAIKPDGRLILVDFNRIDGISREWIFGHVRAGKEVFRAEIQDAGFSLVDDKKIVGLTENYFLIFKKR